jgi:hypothetical protein
MDNRGMGERGPDNERVEAEDAKQRDCFDLAERLRAVANPEEVSRLGDQLGQMVFGD